MELMTLCPLTEESISEAFENIIQVYLIKTPCLQVLFGINYL
jgi:hypothetical protein